jgi:uncharacterized protein (TIGR00251 family)
MVRSAPAEPGGWVRPVADGALLHVHVGPGAARSGVAGFHGTALRVRVRARPVGGAANRELLALLATALGVRPAALSLEAGEHGRDKRVRVLGVAADVVRERLIGGLLVDTPAGHD